MALKDLLDLLSEIAKENRLRTPYIVGGIPRDLLLGQLTEVNDVDITTGSEDVAELAQKFAEKTGSSVKTLKDGHKKVVANGISFDFSSNFKYDQIGDLLARRGMFAPSDLMEETYSRDFTINSLLMPLNFSTVFDLTGMGRRDLERGIIRSPLNSEVSFKGSPIRIIRAFLYSAKYGFEISDEIKEAVKKNVGLLREVDRRYASEKVNEILRMKPEMIDQLMDLGIMSYLPLTKDLSKHLIKNKKLLKVL